ncbi:MAG TPA: ferric reductase-like transmembrane domain-containing protein [Solirubrobacterales bacterium]|nr:ferric reductase-like transmembrane domain-containing protein [Solirubrobacterales bacterium]
MVEPDPANYPWWLASRAAGIVAFVLITTAVLLGLFMASNIYRRPGLKRNLVKLHEQVALTALVAVGAHGVLLLGDAYLRPGLSGIAIPFTIAYRPVWVGLGILAGYLALILGPTYYLRRRIGTKRWRLIHRATVVVFALAVAHSLGSGTDGTSLWFRTLAIASATAVVVLFAIRYRRKAPRPAPVPASPRPGPVGESRTPA